MGWIMVSSGLVDRPSVSHLLLAAHLFLALTLIGLAVWTALGHMYGFSAVEGRAHWSPASKVALIATIGLLIQMAYGAFTAGLKAGHISNTWPLMLGRWVPPALLQQVQPPVTEPDCRAFDGCFHPSLAGCHRVRSCGASLST